MKFRGRPKGTKREDVRRAYVAGMDEDALAKAFGIAPSTLKQYLSGLRKRDPVQRAVDAPGSWAHQRHRPCRVTVAASESEYIIISRAAGQGGMSAFLLEAGLARALDTDLRRNAVLEKRLHDLQNSIVAGTSGSPADKAARTYLLQLIARLLEP